jgi:hypothetical protein
MLPVRAHRIVSQFTALVALAVAAACGAPAPAAPLVSGPSLADSIATFVVATISARDTQTALASPQGASAPTPTTVTLPLPTVSGPTTTPLVAWLPTPRGPAYACDPDIGKRPRDNTEYHPNDAFDVKWTILNTGSRAWNAGVNLAYVSGPQMTSRTSIELPEVQPKKSFSVSLDARAPAEPGSYVMTWKLEGGFCTPYVVITVVKPPGTDP